MSNGQSDFDATVVIATKNRVGDLRRAVRSCIQQSGKIEVLVIDDESNDSTRDMLASEFPSVRVHSNAISTGYIAARNLGARLASGAIIVSIDDDAEFSASNVVSHTVSEFSAPQIGAIAIPLIDVNRDDGVKQQAPDTQEVWVTDRYVGTAHAVRRDVFLDIGGYREEYFHQGEERDLCIRLMHFGYCVRLGTAPPILHYESPKRDTMRMDLYGRRNDVLYVWYNAPLWALPFGMIRAAAGGLLFGARVGRPFRMLKGLVMGFRSVPALRSKRAPVSSRVYCAFRKLQRRGPVPLDLWLKEWG